jgi:hypothetical protein
MVSSSGCPSGVLVSFGTSSTSSLVKLVLLLRAAALLLLPLFVASRELHSPDMDLGL